MLNREQPRVLGRLGARELNEEELVRIAGAGTEHTNVITVNVLTGERDGDG